MSHYRSMRKAKIIGTIGPATHCVEMLTQLIQAGLNVARINMSHGNHQGHAQSIARIRQASLKVGKEIAILIDLQGPKIRVAKLSKTLELKDGQTWVVGPASLQKKYPEYKNCYIPTDYEKLVEDCHPGAKILFDDGHIIAQALEKDREVYKILIQEGGPLSSNKGINLPDCPLSAPAFTEKDREDLLFALQQDCDFVALSFVRRKEDIQEVKSFLEKKRDKSKECIPIISKIERAQAIENFDEILDVTDHIMLARGDLGVEIGNHLVPSVQKRIINQCNARSVPVITATQMLESMTEKPSPTRAEANDVANAIWDGTDAVMLSGEMAVGKYPLETLKIMSKIVEEAEKTPKVRPFLRDIDLSNIQSAIMVAASMVAEKVKAKKIFSLTESGLSCLKIAGFRPNTEVLGITNSLSTARRLCLYWGVTPYHLDHYDKKSLDLQKEVIKKIQIVFSLKQGDKVVITRGDGRLFSQGAAGASNSVKVEIIKE